MGNTVTDYYDTSSTPNTELPNWMSSLPDTIPLSEISIPGTHNSMSFHGGDMVQTQSWSLSSQLMGGIRFVDIRCRHFRNGLAIHHESVYQQCTFTDVLRDSVNFLDRFPTETILMRVKKEYEAAENSDSMLESFKRYLSKYSGNRFWFSNRIPTLRESRGKIVILQNFPGANTGINYSSLDIDDKWQVPTILPGSIAEKWGFVKSHLEAARRGDRAGMYLTFASGASSGAYPYSVAYRVNSELYEFLKGNDRRRLGIIAMDFPGCSLIQQIIERNN